MYTCSLCKKNTKPVIDFRKFFSTTYPETCRMCFKLHMNLYPYFVIPIQGGLLHVFEILIPESLEVMDITDYLRPYYKAYLKTNKQIDAIYIEYLDQHMIDLLDLLVLGHLIVFTNNYKEAKSYEI